jgi:glucokinase
MKLCVDIGGTKLAVSVVRDGVPSERQVAPTPQGPNPNALGEALTSLIGQVCRSHGHAPGPQGIEAIGVSSCGPFRRVDGLIELAAPNVVGAGRSAQLEAPLRTLSPQVRIENDAVAALEAERRWGALQGQAHCAYVTWSTGIGVGLCVDGRTLRGKNGNAGHAGHSFTVSEAAALCGCGLQGDVESIAGGGSVQRQWARTPQSLLEAATAGEPEALALVDRQCEAVGKMLFNLVVTLDLQAIALGGSIFWNHQAWLLPRLQGWLEGRLPALSDGVRLLPAGLGERVGDYGALALLD